MWQRNRASQNDSPLKSILRHFNSTPYNFITKIQNRAIWGKYERQRGIAEIRQVICMSMQLISEKLLEREIKQFEDKGRPENSELLYYQCKKNWQSFKS